MEERPSPNFVTWWDFAVRLVLVAGMTTWAFLIVRPFIALLAWGGILAIAFYPVHQRIVSLFGQRRKSGAVVSTVLVMSALAIPVVILVGTLVSGAQTLVAAYDAGELTVPAPPERIERLPVIGRDLSEAWHLAHQDLAAASERFAPQLERLRDTVASTAANAGWTLLKLAFSVVVMGVFLANAERIVPGIHRLAARIAGDAGETIVIRSRDTIRSVSRGIVGVAFLQAVLLGVACWIAGVPAAGLWALLALIMAISQITPLIAMVPAMVHMFNNAPTWAAVTFLIWCGFVGFLDNVLKPLLLGRGVEAPMLVVFLGAIGGMLLSGIAGLFVGPVILVVGFTVGRNWLHRQSPG